MITQNELNKSLKTNSDQIAIEENGASILYSQIFKNANKITNYLLSEKIPEQANIGIRSNSVLDMVCAMIGIMNARCVFVPLDETLPKKRLANMVSSLEPACVLVSDHFFEFEAFNQISQYDLKSVYENTNNNPIQYPDFDENDSLYIYFTSGTTGVPKGIIGKNCGLLQFLKWEIKKFNIAGDERFSQFISPYFDAFLRDIFVPLLSGSTICVPPKDEDFFTKEKMISWIDEQEISMIHCVPSIFRIFNVNEIASENYKELKYVLLSGEKINPFELKKWYETFDNRIQLVNFYGTTETTMIRFCYLINPKDANKSKIPIGEPIDATEVLILDKDLKPCNSLISGDLYISSKYMTKGYLNNKKLTREKFKILNEGASDEKVVFKTGDVARKLINGSIDLLGRSDRQVKIRGMRIEIDEIENILIKADQIDNGVVTPDTDDKELLIAYFIRNKDLDVETNITAEIQSHLKQHLPKHMIPSRVIEIEGFPLLSNGKINFKELQATKTSKVILEPINEYESSVLGIWNTILGEKPISTDESFQSAGGSSLALMRLIGKIYSEFGVRVSLTDLFKNLTIQKQAALIQGLIGDKNDSYVIRKAEKKSYYAVTSSQQMIFYNYMLDKKSTAYNMPMVWEITGNVKIHKIEETFRILIKRHESLRTEFLIKEDELVQKIKENFDFKLQKVQVKQEHLDQAIPDFCKPFNLESAPLIRVGIIKTENSVYLVVDMHHIICDGISQHLLHREFMSIYKGNQQEPLDLQYKDYAEWENTFRRQEEFIRLREFWLKKYTGKIPKLNLFQKKSTYKSDYIGDYVEFNIDKKEIHSLIEVLKSKNITIFSGLFSILQIMLLKMTGQEDIVIGISTSGRFQEEVENMVGIFMKIIPIRFEVKPEYTFLDYAEILKKYLAEAINKQFYNLIDIKAELNKNKSAQVERLFDVLFNYYDVRNLVGDSANDFALVDYSLTTNTSKYPIEIKVFEEKDEFNFKFSYSKDYLDTEEVKTVASEYELLLKSIANNYDSKIFNFLEISIQEKQTIEDIVFDL